MNNLENNTEASNHVCKQWEDAMANVPEFGGETKSDADFIREIAGEEEITLTGGNMGIAESVKFTPLTERSAEWSALPEELEVLGTIEKIYRNAYEQAEMNPARPMELDEDGKVKIIPGTKIHRFGPSMDVLKGISKTGVVASEWYGVDESESEGICCAFLSEVLDDNDPDVMESPLLKNQNQQLFRYKCALFFDTENPVFRELIKKYDYFQYRRDKAERPDDVQSQYSEEVRHLFDDYIEPNSPGISSSTLTDKRGIQSHWIAIPGGVPPQLINGIMLTDTHDSHGIMEHVEEMSRLFPNATIFDGDRNVLSSPHE